jgi:hypothetical protein
MPADIVVMADCQSNYGVYKVRSDSNRRKFYTVSFGGSEGPAHCTCKAFQYSGPFGDQHCKHVERVWNGACMYNPQWCDGHQPVEFEPMDYNYNMVVEGEQCPNCGGPMVAVRRAV